MKNKFNSISKKKCRICENDKLVNYLDLGNQPPSNSFIKKKNLKIEKSFPLIVQLCTICGLSQLDTVVASEDIFDEYLYFSSTSKALVNHYGNMTENILEKINPIKNSLIVDIGCNDGITLKCYPKNKYKLLGIEPSSTSEAAILEGLKVEKKFFSEKFSKTLVDKYGKASIITATNVFAHVDDIRDFVSGIFNFLEKEGAFIIEFPYLKNMLDENLFDIIYHEHLSYLSVTPLSYLFSIYNLKIFDIVKVDVGASGPGLRVFVSHKDSKFLVSKTVGEYLDLEKKLNYKKIDPYNKFSKNVSLIKQKILKIVKDLNFSNKNIGAFGAPAKGNTMLNYLKLDQNYIKAVADNTPSKIGKLTPGTHIPIVSDKEFSRLNIEYALLLSWNYLDFFLKNSSFIKSGGKFIVPFSEPRILPK